MTSAIITYTTADYKKYAYAQAKEYIRRIQEIVETLGERFGFDEEDCEDLNALFGQAIEKYLRQATFFADDHEADAHDKWVNEVVCSYIGKEIGDAPVPEFEPILQAENTYDDSRPVSTTVRYGEGEDEYVTHVWHPDPQHPDNQPGAVICFSQGPSPFRWRYATVIAPGVLSEVRKEEETGEEM
jgi:hypothetical protein